MARAVLERARLRSACLRRHAASWSRELAGGAGAVMLAEEVIAGTVIAELTDALAAQPPWSDLPVLRAGAPGRGLARHRSRHGRVRQRDGHRAADARGRRW